MPGFTKGYKKYLNSKAWFAKSRACIERAGGRCEECGKRKAVHAHHLTYLRFTRELPEDLKAVCRPCHEQIHGRSLKREPSARERKKRLARLLNEQHRLYAELKKMAETHGELDQEMQYLLERDE